ncbi:MAG TPA: hypothetical protein VGB97_01100 [Candidatus Paceibacterota bacterium]|jgi:hypothetical protein
MAVFTADDWVEKTRGLKITCIATIPHPDKPSTFIVNYEGEPAETLLPKTPPRTRIRKESPGTLGGHDMAELLTHDLDNNGPS